MRLTIAPYNFEKVSILLLSRTFALRNRKTALKNIYYYPKEPAQKLAPCQNYLEEVMWVRDASVLEIINRNKVCEK